MAVVTEHFHLLAEAFGLSSLQHFVDQGGYVEGGELVDREVPVLGCACIGIVRVRIKQRVGARVLRASSIGDPNIITCVEQYLWEGVRRLHLKDLCDALGPDSGIICDSMQEENGSL